MPPVPLRVVTLNVWFDKHHQSARYEAQLNLFQSLNCDVICLQEVTQVYLESLEAAKGTTHPWLAGYTLSAPNFDISFYGTAMLVRTPLLVEFERVELITELDRELLVARLQGPFGKVRVGCVHLESLDAWDMRRHQLEEIGDFLDAEEEAGVPTILMGDFNLCSFWNYKDMEAHGGKEVASKKPFILSPPPAFSLEEVPPSGLAAFAPPPSSVKGPGALKKGDALENESLKEFLPLFVDSWPALHGPVSLENPGGFTFDSQRNAMLHEWLKGDYEQMHYDRVLARVPTDGTFALKACEVLGTGPIPDAPGASAVNVGGAGGFTPARKVAVYLSDH